MLQIPLLSSILNPTPTTTIIAGITSTVITPANPYPDNWDVRVQGPGVLNDVKNQGACGACWAFATGAAIEQAWSAKYGVNVSLSEQQQIDCNTKCNGCKGGWFTTAFPYTTNGLSDDDFYPYTALGSACSETRVNATTTGPSGFVRLPNDVAAIKMYISTKGACAVCVDSTNWSPYAEGIFDSSPPTPICNHGVLLVGYGPDYWLLRNQWGSDWGEDGYIRVANDTTGGLFTNYVYCALVSLHTK